MIRKILLILALFLFLPSFGIENDGYNYSIIKTKSNYAPIRENENKDSKRFTHLDKGVILYSFLETKGFYKVDLGLNSPYWIEKKYVDYKKPVKKKRLSQIKKIKNIKNEKYEIIEIKPDRILPYRKNVVGNSVELTLFDTKIQKKLIENYKGNFKIREENNSTKISIEEKLISGYDVYKKKNSLIFKVRKPFNIDKKKPLKGLIFVIDPGHGGDEFGAVAFNLKEKDLNLEISKKLYNELKKEGAKVYLTRKKDKYKGIYERVDFAKKQKADFLLSIHQNSLPNREDVNKKHGIGVYYYNKEAYPLGVEIKNSLVQKTWFRDDNVNYASFALNRETSPISLLIECGYIIHKEESKKLNDPEFQIIVSKGIVQGIKNYLIKSYQ